MFFKFISLLDLGQLDLGYLVHVESVNYIKVLLFWSSWNPLMYCSASSSGSTKCSRHSGVLASWSRPVSTRGKVERPQFLLLILLCLGCSSSLYCAHLYISLYSSCSELRLVRWRFGQLGRVEPGAKPAGMDRPSLTSDTYLFVVSVRGSNGFLQLTLSDRGSYLQCL